MRKAPLERRSTSKTSDLMLLRHPKFLLARKSQEHGDDRYWLVWLMNRQVELGTLNHSTLQCSLLQRRCNIWCAEWFGQIPSIGDCASKTTLRCLSLPGCAFQCSKNHHSWPTWLLLNWIALATHVAPFVIFVGLRYWKPRCSVQNDVRVYGRASWVHQLSIQFKRHQDCRSQIQIVESLVSVCYKWRQVGGEKCLSYKAWMHRLAPQAPIKPTRYVENASCSRICSPITSAEGMPGNSLIILWQVSTKASISIMNFANPYQNGTGYTAIRSIA